MLRSHTILQFTVLLLLSFFLLSCGSAHNGDELYVFVGQTSSCLTGKLRQTGSLTPPTSSKESARISQVRKLMTRKLSAMLWTRPCKKRLRAFC